MLRPGKEQNCFESRVYGTVREVCDFLRDHQDIFLQVKEGEKKVGKLAGETSADGDFYNVTFGFREILHSDSGRATAECSCSSAGTFVHRQLRLSLGGMRHLGRVRDACSFRLSRLCSR